MSSNVAVRLEYWVQWQVPVCALIIIIPSAVAATLIKKGPTRDPVLAPTHLWLPSWRNVGPAWLLFYRVLALSTMLYLLYLTVASFGFFIFSFYTQWTFALVILYLIYVELVLNVFYLIYLLKLATIISARGCWAYYWKPISHNEERYKIFKKSEETAYVASVTSTKSESELQKTGILETSMEIVYQTCAGSVMLTDIVFWCILFPFTMKQDFQLTLLIACLHSVNAIFLLLDSAFNSLPFTWYGFTYFILWNCSYVTFQWVLHACCISWWPYPFLELATPLAPLWYLALALIHIPCYGLYMLLVRAKNSIFSKVLPNAFLRISGEKKHM